MVRFPARRYPQLHGFFDRRALARGCLSYGRSRAVLRRAGAFHRLRRSLDFAIELVGLFPWGPYLAFGVAAGSALRLIPAERLARSMQWTALAAAAAIACCQYCAHSGISIYAASDFWLNSPAQVLTKLGVILLMLAAAFVWTQYIARDGWSWVRQFGTTSLLVYWVHIELIYGRWMWFFKENLNVLETVILSVVVILFMLGISVGKTRRAELRAWLRSYTRGTPANGLPDPLTVEASD